MSGERERAVERLAAMLWDMCAEGWGALRRTVTDGESVGRNMLVNASDSSVVGIRARAALILDELRLVAIDRARASELGRVALAGSHTPECEWAVQELVDMVGGDWNDEAPRKRFVAIDPALVAAFEKAEAEGGQLWEQRERKRSAAVALADAVIAQLRGGR